MVPFSSRLRGKVRSQVARTHLMSELCQTWFLKKKKAAEEYLSISSSLTTMQFRFPIQNEVISCLSLFESNIRLHEDGDAMALYRGNKTTSWG